MHLWILLCLFGTVLSGEKTNGPNVLLTAQQPHVTPHVLSVSHEEPHATDGHGAAHSGYHVAVVDFAHVETPFVIALWIFLAAIAKIGFHMANKLSSIFPESTLLIVLGILIGLLLFYTKIMTVSPLTPTSFFLFMLPPIVFDAGYFMPNRLFFDNLGTILLFAVAGTIFNTLTIGVSLWAVGLTGLYGVEVHILDAFLFSALISAVDPVAVLAVFEEIHVNEVLYIVVFGESLLNDAVTVVLYHMFEAYAEMGEDNIQYTDVMLGFASFFVVALGGTAIGVIWGFLTGVVTRFTKHVRVIEPILVFVMAYMSYLNAEIFHMSGILAITFCGISAKNYVEANISQKSHTTIKYATKMLSSSAETIIFMFLGVSTVNDEHNWNTWFVIFTILFCTVYRAIGVVILTSLANHFRLHRLNKVEEFVMAYGGLRGAVAFALALTISDKVIHHKPMFVTTTIAMVYFTVFGQGITIKPLVQILRVKKSSKRKVTMNERIHERFMDHLMAGIEDIAGHHGNHHLRDKFKYYDNKYLRRLMVRDYHIHEPKILETFSKLNLRDAHEMLNQNGTVLPRVNTTDASLSNMLRTCTQTSNQPNLGNRMVNNDSSFCNLDMQELDYSPSAKDLSDARIHHMLTEGMFKAPRHHNRKYSRSVIHEPETQPQFRHMMRMQIRHMLSEQYMPKKGGKGRRNTSPNTGANDKASNHISQPKSVTFQPPTLKNDNNGSVHFTNADSSAYRNQALVQDDEGGITFTARPKDAGSNSSLQRTSSVSTATERQLPWKSGYEDDQPIRQNEFPSWVDNKEYNAYVSPTSTYLCRLDDRDPKPPAVFSLFPIEDEPELRHKQEDERQESRITLIPNENIDETDVSRLVQDPTNRLARRHTTHNINRGFSWRHDMESVPEDESPSADDSQQNTTTQL